MKSIVIIFAYFLTFFFFTNTVFAQVVINEVQISPIGERFIELYNPGDSDVDLTGWYIQRKTATGSKFGSLITSPKFENKSINAGGYFLISRNSVNSADIFIDNLTLTDSNTLRLRNSEREDIDQIKLESLNEGESYQKTSDGWTSATPTPSSANLDVGRPNDDVETSAEASGQEQSPLPVTTGASSWPSEPQIFTRVKTAPKVAVVGADILFEGDTLGLKKKPLEGARYSWTFGDGGTKEGQKILYRYNYPGKYIVVLNTSSGTYSASDRVVIEAIPADIEISSVGIDVDSFVEIYNKTKYELNISWWRLRAGSKIFTIPKDTIVLPKSKIIFPPQHTEFDIKKGDSVELLYPNGVVATSFIWTSDVQIIQTPKITQASESKIPAISVKIKPMQILQIDDTKAEEEKEVVENIISEHQATNVFTATDSGGDIYKWLFGVTGISVLSIFGVFLTRKERFIAEADEYEIIEDED